MKAILNLGAGNRIVADAVNHDLWKHRQDIDIAHDLDILPWPWADDSFDEIQAYAVFEHLALSPIKALNECWRILRRGGKLIIKYPLWSSAVAHDDPSHHWWWSERAFEVFDPETKYGKDHPYYTPLKWKLQNSGVIKGRNVKAILEPRK